MQIHAFSSSTLVPSPWKNGGGVTREILSHPLAAGPQDFDWRVSLATIASSGPFSVFEGIDRVFTLLEGEGDDAQPFGGVLLRSADRRIDHRVARPLEPFAFPGDVALDARLHGRSATALNLMLRRGVLRATVSIVETAQPLASSPQGLMFAARGGWQANLGSADPRLDIAAGDGLWWEGGVDGDWSVTPEGDAGDGAGALVVMQLWPA